MVLRSMHEFMHAAQFCSGFFFFCQPKLLLGLLCYEDDSFTILLHYNQGSAVYRWICQVEIQAHSHVVKGGAVRKGGRIWRVKRPGKFLTTPISGI